MTELTPMTTVPKRPGSTGFKLAVGAAIAAVPLGAIGTAIWYLKHLGEARDKQIEKGVTYDASKVARVDPALIKYRQLGVIDTGMQLPRAIHAEKDGRLIVGGDKLIRRFNATGGQESQFAVDDSPFCVTSAEDGTIYVGLRDHVEIYGPDGVRRAVWPAFGEKSWLTSIAVAGKDVWVADVGQKRVFRCTLDGKVELELGKPDEARKYDGLNLPSPHLDVAVTREGLVWISNPGEHRLEAYSRDGVRQRSFGKFGAKVDEFFGCCNPSDFALLSDGSVVTAEKGLGRVKFFDPGGTFLGVVSAPESFGENMLGLDLSVDGKDQVYVLEPGTTKVRVFVKKEGM